MSGKIKYGKVDLLPAKIEPKDVMITISVRMEGDLLDAIRSRAEVEGIPYQTFMKKVLRDHLLGDGRGTSQAELSRRLVALEEIVLGSRTASVAQGKKPGAKRARKRA